MSVVRRRAKEKSQNLFGHYLHSKEIQKNTSAIPRKNRDRWSNE